MRATPAAEAVVKVHEALARAPSRLLTDVERQLNDLMPDLPHIWPNNALDVITARAAMEHLRKHKPRVLFIGFGEDHVVPPKATRHNERRYDDSVSITLRRAAPAHPVIVRHPARSGDAERAHGLEDETSLDFGR